MPGAENGMDWSKTPVNRDTIIKGMKLDGGIPVPKDGTVPEGYHKIYFVVTDSTAKFQDVHFYRQDSDGKWSSVMAHPEAGAEVLTTDAVGKPITDPERADHDWSKGKVAWPSSNGSDPIKASNYSVNGGYFLLPDKWQGPLPPPNPILEELKN